MKNDDTYYLLKNYIDIDEIRIDQKVCIDWKIKKIAKTENFKEDKYKVLNAIKAEKNFLKQPNTNDSSIGIMTMAIMILAVITDIVSMLYEKNEDIFILVVILFLLVSIMIMLFILLSTSISMPKENRRRNEKIEILEYIEFEFQRLYFDKDKTTEA